MGPQLDTASVPAGVVPGTTAIRLSSWSAPKSQGSRAQPKSPGGPPHGLGTDVRYMITGVVLLAAVTIDALARRGQASRGLA